ncbi:MAG TPA: hypothetical protein VN723_00660, partial [Rhizomicrobium sp.]|nr:hypothetical protein [Rhizomicrobium sp.]
MKIDAILVAAVMALSMPAPALAAYRIVDRIKVPDGNFDYATFDPTTGHVFMPRGAFTTVIDAKSGQVSTFSDGAADHIALPIPDTNVLILTERNGAIRILDKISGKIVKDLAGEKNPNSAAYDPVTKLTFVMNKDSGTATIVDAKAGQAVGRIPVSPNTLEFPVADGAGMIFDNIETTGEIAVIDARLRKVVRVIKLSGCEEPSGL